MENKTFLNKISHSVCMQRYNSVIECKRAKKCYLEIGDKWIFSSHGQNFRAGFNYMETSKRPNFTVGRCLVTVYSTGMLSKLFVLPYQES